MGCHSSLIFGFLKLIKICVLSFLLWMITTLTVWGAFLGAIPSPEKQFPIIPIQLEKGTMKAPKLILSGARNEYLPLQFQVKGADPGSLMVQAQMKNVAWGLEVKFYQVMAATSEPDKFQADGL